MLDLPSRADSPVREIARTTGSTERSIDLVVRARDGDDDARERLYQRYVGPLKRWSRGRLPRWARGMVDTDDLVQDTLLRTVNGLERFDPRHSGAFQGYVRQILLNRIRDQVRHAARQPANVSTVGGAVDPGASPLEEVIGHDTAQRYERALASLSEGDREVVLARVEMGLRYADIATALGKPSADAARMAVSRALVRLARAMSS